MRKAPQLDFQLVQQFNLCSRGHEDCHLHPSLYKSPHWDSSCSLVPCRRQPRHGRETRETESSSAAHCSHLNSKEGGVGVQEHKDPHLKEDKRASFMLPICWDYPLYHLRKHTLSEMRSSALLFRVFIHAMLTFISIMSAFM